MLIFADNCNTISCLLMLKDNLFISFCSFCIEVASNKSLEK